MYCNSKIYPSQEVLGSHLFTQLLGWTKKRSIVTLLGRVNSLTLTDIVSAAVHIFTRQLWEVLWLQTVWRMLPCGWQFTVSIVSVLGGKWEGGCDAFVLDQDNTLGSTAVDLAVETPARPLIVSGSDLYHQLALYHQQQMVFSLLFHFFFWESCWVQAGTRLSRLRVPSWTHTTDKLESNQKVLFVFGKICFGCRISLILCSLTAPTRFFRVPAGFCIN